MRTFVWTIAAALCLAACGGGATEWPKAAASPASDAERLVGTWSVRNREFTVGFTGSRMLLDKGDGEGVTTVEYTTGPGPVAGEILIRSGGNGYRARFENDTLHAFLPGLDAYTQYALDRRQPR